MSQSDPVLGKLAAGDGRRDAIHIAIIAVEAAQDFYPGCHVGINDAGQAVARGDRVGIVDPFLTEGVRAGTYFWLCLYPGTITSLRHVWSHPEFPEPETTAQPTPGDAEVRETFLTAIMANPYDRSTRLVYADWLDEHGMADEAGEQREWTPQWQEATDWVTDFASEVNLSCEQLLEAAKLYLDTGKAHCLSFDTPDRVTDSDQLETFWAHYRTLTGKPSTGPGDGGDDRYKSFFRCSC